jgi:hypothetical protein
MSAPTAEQLKQVEAWIRSEAATKPVDQVQEWITTRFGRLAETARAVSDAQLAVVPPGEDWSPIGTLKHVAEWTWQCGEDVLHTSLAGERPGKPAPDFPEDRELLLAKIDEAIASVWAHVQAADPSAFLDVTWEHPFFGQLNWREWHLFLGVHAVDHANQIKELAGA